MKVGILGTGDVAKSLAEGFINQGHEVLLGGRESNPSKLEDWIKTQGSLASTGSFGDAAQFGELLVLATLGTITERVIELAGPENFEQKILIDVTNPLDFENGFPPKLLGSFGNSNGEKHQRLLPKAKVIKAFNSVGHTLMYQPKLGTKPDMFICGNDRVAKRDLVKICDAFGWNTIDIGDIRTAHYLECLCMIWILSASRDDQWIQAFKLVRPD